MDRLINVKKKDRVEFIDGHAQTVTKIEDTLDDRIVRLKRITPDDPDWVYESALSIVVNQPSNNKRGSTLYAHFGPI